MDKQLLHIGTGLSPPPSYRSTSLRFAVLVLTCLTTFGSVFSFNIPQALEHYYQEQFDINQAQFNLLYTLFALPCVFFSIPSGVFMDRVGIRVGMLILTAGAFLGQVLCTVATSNSSYALILIGRAVLGVSYQTLIVGQAAMACLWFKDQQLGLAMGFVITVPQFGNALNTLTTPEIYNYFQSLVSGNLMGCCFCLLGFLCSVGLFIIDRKAQRIDRSSHEYVSNQTINFKDLKQFRRPFWVLVTILMLTIGIFIAFMDNGNSYLCQRFGYQPVSAGRLLLITYLVTILTSPFIGTLVDRFGNKRTLIIITTLIFMLAHLILYLSDTSTAGPVVALVLLGFGYSMYASCMYPAVADLVTPNAVGTAYGIQVMLGSLSMALFPLFSGLLIQSQQVQAKGFQMASIFFICMGLLNVLLSCMLFVIDRDRLSVLDRPSRQSVSTTADEKKLLDKSLVLEIM